MPQLQPTEPPDTLRTGGLTPLQRSRWCFLQPQPTRSQDTLWGEVLPLSKEAVGVFYSPSRLGTFDKKDIHGSYFMFFFNCLSSSFLYLHETKRGFMIYSGCNMLLKESFPDIS